jgi:hypothetical protein
MPRTPQASEQIFGDYKLSYAYSLHYREDHAVYLKAIRPSGRLYLQLKNNNHQQPIDAGFFIWNGHAEELVTLLTQRAITGLECFLPFALTMFATVKSSNGSIERALWNAFYNPKPCNILELMDSRFPSHKFTKRNRERTVNLLYRCLPFLASVPNEIPKDLYKDLCRFYDEVRNKIAHGAVVTSANPEPLLATYELIEKVYLWIETWMPRGIQSGGFKVQWR